MSRLQWFPNTRWQKVLKGSGLFPCMGQGQKLASFSPQCLGNTQQKPHSHKQPSEDGSDGSKARTLLPLQLPSRAATRCSLQWSTQPYLQTALHADLAAGLCPGLPLGWNSHFRSIQPLVKHGGTFTLGQPIRGSFSGLKTMHRPLPDTAPHWQPHTNHKSYCVRLMWAMTQATWFTSTVTIIHFMLIY